QRRPRHPALPHGGAPPRLCQARQDEGRGRSRLDPCGATQGQGHPRPSRQGRRRGRGRGDACGEGARRSDEATHRRGRRDPRRQGDGAPRGLMTEKPEGAVPATTTGRSGRDLPMAVAVGAGMLVVVGLALFVWQPAFVGLAVIAVGAALWELAQAFTRRDVHLPLAPLWVGAAGILVSAYVAGP